MLCRILPCGFGLSLFSSSPDGVQDLALSNWTYSYHARGMPTRIRLVLHVIFVWSCLATFLAFLHALLISTVVNHDFKIKIQPSDPPQLQTTKTSTLPLLRPRPQVFLMCYTSATRMCYEKLKSKFSQVRQCS